MIMKVSVKKIDVLKREMKFEIPKERVSEKMEEVLKDLGKVAKIKGFRQGKVPRHILEAQHGNLAKEETVKKLIPEVYQEGIKQENIDPLEMPEIEDVQFKDGTITFTAKVDIKPEVKINNYKSIPVKRKSSAVTEDEINKTFDYFMKSQGKDDKTKIDDQFVRGLGFPNLDAFKESLTRQLEIDKDRQNRVDVENQIVEALLKDAKLTVPQLMVKKQFNYRLEEAEKHFKKQDFADTEIQKKKDEMRKELQQTVEKDVKLFLIFDKIAELEGIHVHEGESLPKRVMEYLLKEANWEA